MIIFEIARAHACARVLACKTAFFKNSARARAARVLGVRVPRAHAFRTRRGRTLALTAVSIDFFCAKNSEKLLVKRPCILYLKRKKIFGCFSSFVDVRIEFFLSHFIHLPVYGYLFVLKWPRMIFSEMFGWKAKFSRESAAIAHRPWWCRFKLNYF